MAVEPFSIFTSLRYDVGLCETRRAELYWTGWNFANDSPLYLLDLHRDRLLQAALHWQWQKAVERLSGAANLSDLAQKVQSFVGESHVGPLRLKILINSEGVFSFEKFDTAVLPLQNLFPKRLPSPGAAPDLFEPSVPPRFVLVVDSAATAKCEFTHYKTTKRHMYDAARQRAGIRPSDEKEVLLVNQDDGSIMEGSLTTPYFWRDGRWVTPPVSKEFSRDEGSGGQNGTSRRWALERGLAIEQIVHVDSLIDAEECWISNGVGGFRQASVSLSKHC